MLLNDISEFYERIGHSFQNEDYLIHALTRTAFARENNVPLEYTMDYLAVLGDAVIEILVIEDVISAGVTEKGEITRQKVDRVNMSALRRIGESLELPDLVLWGKGEIAMHIWTSGRVLAECFEALMGAVYMDGGMDAARTVFVKVGMKKEESVAAPHP